MPETASTGIPPTARQHARYGFIDLLRGFALVFMIETHVVNAYLAPALRQSGFFFWLTFINGLVAPTFLFASGFSVMLQGRRHWEDWLRLRLPFWRQMRRLGFILLLAYAFHLQSWKWSEYFAASDPMAWRRSLQVDILHCIVVSLLAVHLLIFLARTREAFAGAALATGALASAATPWIWSQDFTGRLPLPLALYLNPHGISLFPLFPWIAFLLAGSAAAVLFLKAVSKGNDARFMLRLLPLSALLIAAGVGGGYVPFSLPGHQNYFTTSPLYVMLRLGCVLLLCVLLYLLEKFLRFAPRPIQTAGQESLMVYCVHLWAIYGLLRGNLLAGVLGREAGYLGCLLISLGLIFSLLWLAGQWQELKKSYPRQVKRAQGAAVILSLAAFFLF
jgi:uncharacterized membrane protein